MSGGRLSPEDILTAELDVDAPLSKGDTRLEIASTRIEQLRDQVDALKSERTDLYDQIARIQQDRNQALANLQEARREQKISDILSELMKPMADKVFNFMVAYSVVVGGILLVNALGWFTIVIEPEVLSFLVGSTAVTVIGLVGTVVAGVFVGGRK